jgi:hypothetical protein
MMSVSSQSVAFSFRRCYRADCKDLHCMAMVASEPGKAGVGEKMKVIVVESLKLVPLRVTWHGHMRFRF